MKDKRVDGLLERITVLERRCEALKREYETIRDYYRGLNERLKENRCVDEQWDLHGIWINQRYIEMKRVDIPLLEKQFNALVEYLGLEWQVETTQAGFQEKAEETE